MYQNDEELYTIIREQLYTPVMGDILDQLGCYHQFLPREIQPMTLDMKVVGRAMPVLFCDVYGEQTIWSFGLAEYRSTGGIL